MIGIVERPEQQDVHPREDGDIDRHAECEGEGGNREDARRLTQGAEGVFDVLAELVHRALGSEQGSGGQGQ